jgi:hypothetical protein
MTEFDAATQATIDASIAAANAAEASGNHAGRAQAATQALAAWSAAYKPAPSAEPKTGVEAAARLAHLNKDAAFRAGVISGGGEHFKTFQRLTEMVAGADPIDLVIAGHEPPGEVDQNAGAVAGPREVVQGAKDLLERGFDGGEIHELLSGELIGINGEKLSAEEIELGAVGGELWLARAIKDQEFAKKLMAGDQPTVDLWNRVCAVVAVGKRGMP